MEPSHERGAGTQVLAYEPLGDRNIEPHRHIVEISGRTLAWLFLCERGLQLLFGVYFFAAYSVQPISNVWSACFFALTIAEFAALVLCVTQSSRNICSHSVGRWRNRFWIAAGLLVSETMLSMILILSQVGSESVVFLANNLSIYFIRLVTIGASFSLVPLLWRRPVAVAFERIGWIVFSVLSSLAVYYLIQHFLVNRAAARSWPNDQAAAADRDLILAILYIIAASSLLFLRRVPSRASLRGLVFASTVFVIVESFDHMQLRSAFLVAGGLIGVGYEVLRLAVFLAPFVVLFWFTLRYTTRELRELAGAPLPE